MYVFIEIYRERRAHAAHTTAGDYSCSFLFIISNLNLLYNISICCTVLYLNKLQAGKEGLTRLKPQQGDSTTAVSLFLYIHWLIKVL